MSSSLELPKLKDVVRDFETKVESPVSGDDSRLRDEWQAEVMAVFNNLCDLVERRRQEIHAKLFAQIASQDASERDGIDQMKHSDTQIDEFQDVVKAHLAAFAIGATEDGRGADIEGQVAELRHASQALCLSVLTQEETVTSWFAESFDPDV